METSSSWGRSASGRSWGRGLDSSVDRSISGLTFSIGGEAERRRSASRLQDRSGSRPAQRPPEHRDLAGMVEAVLRDPDELRIRRVGWFGDERSVQTLRGKAEYDLSELPVQSREAIDGLASPPSQRDRPARPPRERAGVHLPLSFASRECSLRTDARPAPRYRALRRSDELPLQRRIRPQEPRARTARARLLPRALASADPRDGRARYPRDRSDRDRLPR
jgi:hypothetical protein